MKKFFAHLTKSVPVLAHFEHATVIVVGSEWLLSHMTSIVMLLATLVVFLIFQISKEA